MLTTPILFLIFNRPDTTARVFDAIRKAKPQQLYIAADGPRANNENDIENSARVKQVVSGIDWECQVKTLYRETNLGCGKAVSEAISWFFAHVEEGIILEDNFPNTILEAQLVGTPVIGFPSGGIPEMIEEGKNGLVAAEISSAALQQTILNWLAAKESFDAEWIALDALQKYALEVQAAKLVELYKTVL